MKPETVVEQQLVELFKNGTEDEEFSGFAERDGGLSELAYR